jgi:hypothetical protein
MLCCTRRIGRQHRGGGRERKRRRLQVSSWWAKYGELLTASTKVSNPYVGSLHSGSHNTRTARTMWGFGVPSHPTVGRPGRASSIQSNRVRINASSNPIAVISQDPTHATPHSCWAWPACQLLFHVRAHYTSVSQIWYRPSQVSLDAT